MQHMKRCKLLFVITQFYKGGAEVALLNLLKSLPQEEYEVDFLVFDQMIISTAHSLIPDIPEWVTVCNAAEKEGHLAVLRKIWFKIYRKLTKRQLCRRSALRFIKNKEYDYAFSYGEWMSPEFVATRVKAKEKYVWIHTDIDKAPFVNEKILLGYDDDYTGYIYVSENSKNSAETAFPMLRGKGVVVHNMCDEEEIIRASKEEIDARYPNQFLLSVGNLREEKNYPRQIEALRILRDRGMDITWLCVGSTANVFVNQQVKNLIEKYELKDKFLFLGVDSNPYKYMSKAAAVTVLSDFESWSLVITEAKLIGTPVIATKTSGALEQLDGTNGVLVDFTAEAIADGIQTYLQDEDLQKNLRNNLKDFSLKQKVKQEFEALIKR